MNVLQNLIPNEYATMAESTTQSSEFPESTGKDVMTEILREGAQQMLAQAIQEEVVEWIEQRAELHDAQGRHQVVRNGYLPKRTITTGTGHLPPSITFVPCGMRSIASTASSNGRLIAT